jgi:glycosyltransferase involved in cell wall biosynthesis
VGDYAIFADPYDQMDIAQALERGIQQSDSMRLTPAQINSRREKFSWEKMADQTLNLYLRSLGVFREDPRTAVIASPEGGNP